MKYSPVGFGLRLKPTRAQTHVPKHTCAGTWHALLLEYGVCYRVPSAGWWCVRGAWCVVGLGCRRLGQVVHEKLGIVKGMITTVHDVTGTQTLVDSCDTGVTFRV